MTSSRFILTKWSDFDARDRTRSQPPAGLAPTIFEARRKAHADRRALSLKLLEEARKLALLRSKPFDSKAARLVIENALFERSGRRIKPYSWQLDVAEALLLGLDCVVIAGTGFGKSLPFILSLLAGGTYEDMIIVVICPLNALEEDLVSDTVSFKLGLFDITDNTHAGTPF